MSLETAISTLNGNIEQLIAVLQNQPAPQTEPAKNDKPAENKTTAPKAEADEETAEAQTETAAEEIAENVDVEYDDLKAEFLKLAKGAMDKAQGILAEFGIKKMPELDKDQYPAMLNALQKANAEG